MMQVLAPRKTSLVTIAAVGLAALMLLLTVRSAAADLNLLTVTPNSGPISGGTLITITGTELPTSIDDVAIEVGDELVPAETVNGDGTQITAYTPAGDLGAVDVVVTNLDNDQTDTIFNGFTYLEEPPQVIGVAPATGSVDGGTAVTIFGNNFADGATVQFGEVDATAVDFVSEHELTATAPAGTGVVDVIVTNDDDQASTLEDAFTYEAAAPGEGEIISGDIPATGFGLFVFGGGTNAQLLEASECPQATATFYATNSSGGFVAYIPGSGVAAVNAAWNALFPSGIPELEPLIGKCA
jgi:hypothetical protein